MKWESQQITSPLWTAITAQISQFTQQTFIPKNIVSVGGGCINQAYSIHDEKQQFFIKLNKIEYLAMFEAEAAGLQEILDSSSLRVPRPFCSGKGCGHSWLVLEFIDLRSQGDAAALGVRLANMHQYTSKNFGWSQDNTIGLTRQKNTINNDWITFWRQQRLGYQLQLARKNGYTDSLQSLGEQLLSKFHHFFAEYTPLPSLLHGDLWGGNYAFDSNGCPVIFDPAVYYGDREADLAMTELFGGFSSRFYAAYHATWPTEAEYTTRKQLYNLYHILNHLNLFGPQYLNQAKTMLKKLLAELG